MADRETLEAALALRATLGRVLEWMEKAGPLSHLPTKRVLVTRGGKTFWQTVHINPNTGQPVLPGIEGKPEEHSDIPRYISPEEMAASARRTVIMESAKLAYAVDPVRAWQQAVDSYYTYGNLPLLAVREMLQNSVDACDRAIRQGQIPRTGAAINITIDESTQTITFEDNGIGMDLPTIQSKFLTLTGSDKGADDSGGFGVAKAVILGASGTGDWTLETRDIVVHSRQVGSDEDLPESEFKGPARQGTKLTLRNVRYNSNHQEWYYGVEGQIRDLLESSNPKIPIRITLNGQEITYRYKRSRGTRMASFEDGWGEGNEATVTSYKVAGRGGHIFLQLDGMTQKIDTVYSQTPIGRDFVVNIHTTNLPGSPDYPFSIGRDAIRSTCPGASKLLALEEYIRREKLSAGNKEEWKVEHHGGGITFSTGAKKKPGAPDAGDAILSTLLGSGKPKVPETSYTPSEEEVGEVPQSPTGTPGRAGREAGGDTGLAGPTPDVGAMRGGGSGIEVKEEKKTRDERLIAYANELRGRLDSIVGDYSFDDRGPDPLTITHWERQPGARKKWPVVDYMPLLAAWNLIANITAHEYGMTRICAGNFGVGFIRDPTKKAMAYNAGDGNQYVMLNPHYAEEMILAARNKPNPQYYVANYLYSLACHELAHLSMMGSGHDEDYAAHREDIANETGHLLPIFAEIATACFSPSRQNAKLTLAEHTDAYAARLAREGENLRAKARARKKKQLDRARAMKRIIEWDGDTEEGIIERAIPGTSAAERMKKYKSMSADELLEACRRASIVPSYF